MFVTPPFPSEGDLQRIRRRPSNWWRLASHGWHFLPENRGWDADEREWISCAIGLHQLSPSEWANGQSNRWWKEIAREYCQCRNLGEAFLAATKIDVDGA
jgi:hypothetical protein